MSAAYSVRVLPDLSAKPQCSRLRLPSNARSCTCGLTIRIDLAFDGADRRAGVVTQRQGEDLAQVSTEAPRTKPTSTRGHFAWQPNPDRSSPYRYVDSVQPSGASSRNSLVAQNHAVALSPAACNRCDHLGPARSVGEHGVHETTSRAFSRAGVAAMPRAETSEAAAPQPGWQRSYARSSS